MSFLYPEYLTLLIPLGIFFFKMAKGFKNRLHLIIIMLLFISMSRPVLDKEEQQSSVKGRDIVIALDVSFSMNANDLKPNRYEYAKECIKELLKNNQNDNVMLIVFTTNPLLISPPTTDHTIVLNALEALEKEYILTKGTSLLNLFEYLNKIDIKQKNFILITDGGEETDANALAKEIKYNTKSFSILALGDDSGSSVKKHDGSLLKDKHGHLVISRVNPVLKEIAKICGATYIQASSSAKKSASELNDALSNANRTFTKKEHKYIELYQGPLFLASLLFLLLHTKGIKYLLVLLAIFSPNINASILDSYHLSNAYTSYISNDFNTTINELRNLEDDSLQSRIIEANTLYKLKEHEKALKVYLSIQSSSPKIKQGLYYNIANCFAVLGNYTDAKIFYAKALQIGDDADALHNLKAISFKKNRSSKGEGKTMPKSQQKSQSKGEFKSKNKNTLEKQKEDVEVQNTKDKYPISSKAYELINEGYINETKPW
jgi:Ca-activated chloride channel family protein